MMKLYLKGSLERKVLIGENPEGGDNIFFEIDYPTLEQQGKLDELKYEALNRRMITENMNDEFTIDAVKYQEYKRRFIQYTVKGWTGLGVECKLVNNALDEKLLMRLTNNEKQLEHIFQVIKDEIEFTETDKKKLSSEESSPETDN